MDISGSLSFASDALWDENLKVVVVAEQKVENKNEDIV